MGFQKSLIKWILNSSSGTPAPELPGAVGSGSDFSSVPLSAPGQVILPATCRVSTVTPLHSQGSGHCALHPTRLLPTEPPCRKVAQVIRVFLWFPLQDAQGVGSTSEISPHLQSEDLGQPSACHPFPPKAALWVTYEKNDTHIPSVLHPLVPVCCIISSH